MAGQPVNVAHGSQITLRHTHGRTCWMHSHEHVFPVRYPDGRGSSHQQQVRLFFFISRTRCSSQPDRCDQIGRNFANLAKFKSLWDILGIVLAWHLANFCTYFGKFYAPWKIFFDVNAHRVKNNVAIWSHCSQVKLENSHQRGKYHCTVDLLFGLVSI